MAAGGADVVGIDACGDGDQNLAGLESGGEVCGYGGNELGFDAEEDDLGVFGRFQGRGGRGEPGFSGEAFEFSRVGVKAGKADSRFFEAGEAYGQGRAHIAAADYGYARCRAHFTCSRALKK